ncbi:hypothetical protein [Streptacidiphilus sp. P02-A3a]|uniref:hypothetical protein n=1 Tax=Streptacidiphilus sp. P02-A3a TaxID=2704468 RepID=UPI0015FA8C72|nr:hypothetical protein [Streptacidiphilus sp. P02-A3a]QMU73232.1 hypothetical protein GXP74_38385 [Streptacidiphilus sp. P02-A3a]
MTAQSGLSVGQLAAALCLKTDWIDELARNGHISYTIDQNGHRVYDPVAVRAEIERLHSRPLAPGFSTGGALREIDSLDLTAWAVREGLEGELPELVRLLLVGSRATLTKLQIPTYEGTESSGWDAIVEAADGTRHIPVGTSAWEMGRGRDADKKANSDYEKRTADPLGLDPARTTFVFVTPCKWPKARAWASAKRAEGNWKDVRAYDAGDLADWFDYAPTAYARAARILGRDPKGTAGLGAAWSAWSAYTVPVLPAGLLTAGREAQGKALLDALTGPAASVWVDADSEDEALGFILAVFAGLPEQWRETAAARSLVVRSLHAWDDVLSRIEGRCGHILIPAFPQAPVAQAVEQGHYVVVPASRRRTPAPGALSIGLPRLSRFPAWQCLVADGVPERTADEISRLARLSLAVARRRFAADGSGAPKWASAGEAPLLLPALLAGAWEEERSADQSLLAGLAAQPYPVLRERCVRWAQEADTPLRLTANVWFAVSPADAWGLLLPYAHPELLGRFRDAVLRVLPRSRPASAQALAAFLAPDADGETQCSDRLRVGLADTLALIATHPADKALDYGQNGAEFAEVMVRELLHPADGRSPWLSLHDVLPQLAEAAPDEFCAALDDALDDGSVFELLASETPTTRDDAELASLMSALERLAYSPEYMGSAVHALARIAEEEHHRNSGKRPRNSGPGQSLRQVFHPRGPQTGADYISRLAALDQVRRIAPETGWSLMLGLLPSIGSALKTSDTPRWRDWPSTPAASNPQEQHSLLDEVLTRMVEDAGDDGDRWSALIDTVPYLPEQDRRAVLDTLGEAHDRIHGTARTAVSQALDKVVRQHRRHPNAKWARPAEIIDPIATVAERFSDVTPIQRMAQLFDWHVEVGPWTGEAGDLEAERNRAQQGREDAVSALLESAGVPGLLAFAAHCNAPALVGDAVARVGGVVDEEVVPLLDDAEPTLRQVAEGYVTVRFDTAGWDWASPLLAEATVWPVARTARFLARLRPSVAVYDAVQALGTEVESLYWASARPGFDVTGPGRQRAARALLAHGRPLEAICLLASAVASKQRPDPALITQALQAADPAQQSTDPVSNADEISQLLDYLGCQTGVDPDEVAALEWRYLLLTGSLQRPARVLHARLARDPELFVDIVEMAYPPAAAGDTTGERQEPAVGQAQLIILGQTLLLDWREVAGQSAGGPGLTAWVRSARRLLADRGVRDPGDFHIGRMLQRLSDPDGTVPGREACQLIEDSRSRHLENGIQHAFFISGVTALPDHASTYPRTQRVLREVVKRLRQLRRRSDEMAQLLEDLAP